MYTVKLEEFEGPLDLLVELVQKEEVDILEISILGIIHEFVEYVRQMDTFNVHFASEFIVWTARLIYLKSKLLLPPSQKTEEIEEFIERETKDIINAILEYRRYKRAAKMLGVFEDNRSKVFSHKQDLKFTEITEYFSDTEEKLFDTKIINLVDAFQSIIKKAKEDETITLIKEKFSISKRIRQILGTFQDKEEIKLSELFEEEYTKLEVLVTFIALLEMIRLQYVTVQQVMLFGPILIKCKKAIDLEEMEQIENIIEYR